MGERWPGLMVERWRVLMAERQRRLKVLFCCVLVLMKSKGGGRSISIASSNVKIHVRGKAAKNAFSLPGYKLDPSKREPLRISYESLSKKIQSSEMAEFWGWEEILEAVRVMTIIIALMMMMTSMTTREAISRAINIMIHMAMNEMLTLAMMVASLTTLFKSCNKAKF